MKDKFLFQSTRSNEIVASAPEAILSGIAPDGGLFVPAELPHADVRNILSLDPIPMAAAILHIMLPSFSEEQLIQLVTKGYTAKFDTSAITPLCAVNDMNVLELFHGPTCAFKDIALCLLPHLLKASAKSLSDNNEILILTATSGDTGKAALEGFRDVEGTRILVFYPRDGVSAVQKAQMVTQQGNNTHVCSVEGNFDDAQTGVKIAFRALQEEFLSQGVRLSSANSINIGRLAPQVFYYFSAYRNLIDSGKIAFGDFVDYSVPTGNFGDILAGYYAKLLGLPVGRLICASNANNVLTDFLNDGTYDRCRPFYTTYSPSMDILVSSNLERLLYLLSNDTALVSSLMRDLSVNGKYSIPASLLEQLQQIFWSDYCDDTQTLKTIHHVWKDNGYLLDPHTAVAWCAAEHYREHFGREREMVVLSTASPFKFPEAVLSALGIPHEENGFAAIHELSNAVKMPIPKPLQGLENKPVRHRDSINPKDLTEYVRKKAVECK